jgi:hypothetical protein
MPEAWDTNPALMVEFYNQRRQQVRTARPDADHSTHVNLARFVPHDWLRVILFRPDSPPHRGSGVRTEKTQGHHAMKDPTVRGVVHLIEETKTFGQKGFRKRLVVLEQSKGTFTNFIPVEFMKDGCDAVDDLAVGDEIEVTYRLSGRRWQRDEASEVKFFLSAEGLSFKALSGSGRAPGGPGDATDPNDAFAEAGDDDVPF